MEAFLEVLDYQHFIVVFTDLDLVIYHHDMDMCVQNAPNITDIVVFY